MRISFDIQTADALAYQQSAQGTTDTQLNAMLGTQFLAIPRWLVGVLTALIAILALVALRAVIRRRKLS